MSPLTTPPLRPNRSKGLSRTEVIFTQIQSHPSGYLGGRATPWSAERMLDGQHQKVDIPTHARTAYNGLLQERLKEDLCWIVPHVPPMNQLVKRLNWTGSYTCNLTTDGFSAAFSTTDSQRAEVSTAVFFCWCCWKCRNKSVSSCKCWIVISWVYGMKVASAANNSRVWVKTWCKLSSSSSLFLSHRAHLPRWGCYELAQPSLPTPFLFCPRSGKLRTQKLKSPVVRTQSLNVLPLKAGVGQFIAAHTTLTARDFFLSYFYLSGPFTCIFSKSLPTVSCVFSGWHRFLCKPAE